jgi:hypothetical protein
MIRYNTIYYNELHDTRSGILGLFVPLSERVGKTTTDDVGSAESQ